MGVLLVRRDNPHRARRKGGTRCAARDHDGREVLDTQRRLTPGDARPLSSARVRSPAYAACFAARS